MVNVKDFVIGRGYLLFMDSLLFEIGKKKKEIKNEK
jgi:hypothetical protein